MHFAMCLDCPERETDWRGSYEVRCQSGSQRARNVIRNAFAHVASFRGHRKTARWVIVLSDSCEGKKRTAMDKFEVFLHEKSSCSKRKVRGEMILSRP